MSDEEQGQSAPEGSSADDEFWALIASATESEADVVADNGNDEPESPEKNPETLKVVEPPSGVCRALILSPIEAPAALHAGLQMVGAREASVIGTSRGSAVFMEVPQEGSSQEDQMSALLGDDRPIPASIDQMASLVSKMAKGGSVALTSWTSDEEEGTTGSIVARRYVNGRAQDKLSAGIVLAGQDLICEELLLGRITPEEAAAITKRGRWTGWMRGPGFRG